jgi:hypothetical protein
MSDGVPPMTGEDWKRIKQIAGDAWTLPEAEREAYARSACAENEPLRIEVMHLLRAMTEAAAAFDRLVIGSIPLVGEDRRTAGRRATDRKPDRS